MATVESASSPISNNKNISKFELGSKEQGLVQNNSYSSEHKTHPSSITMDNKNTNKPSSSNEPVLEFSKLPPKERRRLKRLVHPSKRKRTAVACDICKRRKQKVFLIFFYRSVIKIFFKKILTNFKFKV